MAERVSPWRSKPSQEVVDLLQQVGTVQLFLVQRPGPTSFIVRELDSEVKRKVQIGSRISCSCSPVGANGTCKELCLHILFVMVKVLRVPVSNPLLWQLSLSDRELEEVLRCSMQPERPAQETAKAKPTAEKTPAGQVKRKEIDEEDPCPICYEDMVGQDLDNLVWCRFGCGRNVHGKCMGVWMEHQVQSLGKELTCPLCRSEWGEFKWRPPPPKRKQREERKDVHYGTHCGACKKAPLVGKRYRCVICADFDLCESCFSGGHHPQHPFAVKDTPKSFGAPAERPAMMPTALPIARVTVGPAGGGAGGGGGGNSTLSGGGASTSVSGGAGPMGQTSPRHGGHGHLGQRTHSHSLLADAAVGAGGGGEPDGEADGPGERRASGSGGREALVVGSLAQPAQAQFLTPPRQGGGGAAGARHPVRGTTVARAGAAGRAGAEEHASPPSLEARLASQRRPLLAVEGLTVGPAGGAAAGGGGGGGTTAAHCGPQELSDMVVRRAALGQPSRPVLVRRTRSTVLQHDRMAGEGPGGAGPSADLNLGLAGVPLNAGGERSVSGEAPGPGPGSMAAANGRQQGAPGMPPRHPPRPSGQMSARPGMSARPHPQPHVNGAMWGHPPAAGGAAAAAAPGPPPDLILQGRVLHGDGSSPGPDRRPPLAPQSTTQHGPAGAHGVLTQQPSVGVRCRGPPPRYVPPQEHLQPGLRRSHSAGPQGPMGLAVTARSMAPHPLTPVTPVPVPLPQPPPVPAAASLPGNLQGGGPYGPQPYGNETYGGAIQYDDNLLVAFTHHIPGPAASFREGLESGGWMGTGEGAVAAQGEGGYRADSDGDYVEFDAQEEEFPRGPASPSLHLFSSRPNTVPSELVSDLYSQPRGMSRSLSHSHSFTHSPNGRRSSRLGLGLTLSRGNPAGECSPERPSPLPVATPPAGPGGPCTACSPRTSRAGSRPPPVGSGTLGADVGRDSVLLASVRMDAVDDWMDQLRQQRQQRPSRDGGGGGGGGGGGAGAGGGGAGPGGAASTGQSLSGGVALIASPRTGPAPGEERVLAPSVSSSLSGFGGMAAAGLRVSVANMSIGGGEEGGGTPTAAKAEPTISLSASFEDTLSAFMVEQGMAPNPAVQRTERADSPFTTYGNPVFNRPYTLDMSFQQ